MTQQHILFFWGGDESTSCSFSGATCHLSGFPIFSPGGRVEGCGRWKQAIVSKTNPTPGPTVSEPFIEIP